MTWGGETHTAVHRGRAAEWRPRPRYNFVSPVSAIKRANNPRDALRDGVLTGQAQLWERKDGCGVGSEQLCPGSPSWERETPKQ